MKLVKEDLALEFKSYMQFRLVSSNLEVYGLIQNSTNNEYLMRSTVITYITDLGLSRKNDESDLKDSIYSILPYIAPEMLTEQTYIIASDVYSLGIIVTEMSTGKPHYDIE
ncbi:hypothetical protein C2G38_2174394 [Gigaspora rosea]|uniref:Protein kinase domain-containing protein n=1 Tax=Gigaspora rosea TaxID=44941 RepID=A0A397VII4_9GLOM|nr:hypothetical protein C2G38_2174394 [Gigaspora rosea]